MNLLLLQTWTDEQLSAYIDLTPGGWVANLLPAVIWLVVITSLLATVSSLFSMVNNLNSLKKFAISFLSIIFLALICYFTASAIVPEEIKDIASPGVYQAVGAGISMVIALTSIGLFAIIFGIIKSALKL